MKMIPQQWSEVKLKDICTKFLNGGTPSRSEDKYWLGEIPWITGADIVNQKVAQIRRYINQEAIHNSSTNLVKKGNLLVVTRTGVGKMAIAPFDIAISQDLTGIYLDKDRADIHFIFYFFNLRVPKLESLVQGTSINGITRNQLSNQSVFLPPLLEQKKIARILGTWDQAIDLTERLIEVKERQKQGFMQQLLPGSARLSDSDNPQNTSFGKLSKEWNTVEFGNIATLSVRKFNPKKEESNFDCIELEHIDQGTGRLLGAINSSTQASTKNVFQKGQVLFGKLRPYLKKYWLATFEGVCSSEIWVLEGKPDICINGFLYYLIQSHRFSQAANVTSGSKMPRADWDYLSNIAFFLPSLPEQRKIAAVLFACDQEIELLSRKVGALKEQQKGLMQQLLTGQVRVAI